MQSETEIRTCPDCGEAMEPQVKVSCGRHVSRWWRCSNGQCRAQWLLPMFGAEPEMNAAWTF